MLMSWDFFFFEPTGSIFQTKARQFFVLNPNSPIRFTLSVLTPGEDCRDSATPSATSFPVYGSAAHLHRSGKREDKERSLIQREEKHKPMKNMERMDELVLKHETHGGIKHLSFVSRPHMSPKETFSLPFYEADAKLGGKTVVCNLTTKEFKLLTPPNEDAFFCNSGLGYDPKSDDYKVIRNHCPSSTAEVYSLENNSWKVISGPGNDINTGPECGVYLGGKCYWIVWMYTPEYDGVQDFILSFDFTNESFAQLLLPLPLRPHDQDHVRDFKIDLFDCNGLLSVVGFKSVEDYETRVAKHFELWVCENGVWARSFSAILVDVERPFGVKDGRFLFLEGNSICKHNHLMVYDWIKEELREHKFYDVQPSQMLVFSYVENTTMLPDAKPLINGAQNDDEDSSENVLRRCRRRDKVPKSIGRSAQDVEPLSKKVFKRCSPSREKATSSQASQ